MRLGTPFLLALLVLAAPALAQQGEPSPTQSTEPIDRERLVERLERTIEFSQRIIEKNQEALERLKEGEDPREVLRSMRAPDLQRSMREKREPRRTERQRPPVEPISDEDSDRIRAYIAEHLPEVEDQLDQIAALGPDAVRPVMTRLATPITEIMRLETTDPTLAKLKLAEFRAGLAYVEAVRLYRVALRTGAPQSERDTRRAKVEQAASARFDTLVRIKLHEIETLSARVESLRASLDELVAQRDDQIQAQIDSASRTPGTRLNRPVGTNDGPSDD
jgi:hypothetical protein